jgi:hypothetical protein
VSPIDGSKDTEAHRSTRLPLVLMLALALVLVLALAQSLDSLFVPPLET